MAFGFLKPPRKQSNYVPDRATASGGENITFLVTGSREHRRAKWEIWNRAMGDFDLGENYDAHMGALFVNDRPREFVQALYYIHELKARGLPIGRFVDGEYKAPKRMSWEEYDKQPDLLRAPRTLCPGVYGEENPGSEPPIPDLTLKDIIAAVNGK